MVKRGDPPRFEEHEAFVWQQDSQFEDGVRSCIEEEEEEAAAVAAQNTGADSTINTQKRKKAGGGSFWGGGSEDVRGDRFNEGKKKQALAACAKEHEALIHCLGKGAFVSCSSLQRSFWDCYANHRGIRGNKIAAWFSSLSIFGGHGKEMETAPAGKSQKTDSSVARDISVDE